MKANILSKSSENHLTNKESISVIKRLIFNVVFAVLCFGFSFYFVSDLFEILKQPFNVVMQSYITAMPKRPMMMAVNPGEFFIILVKVAVFSASIIVLPFLAAQFYVYRIQAYGVNEKRNRLGSLYFAALSLFLVGVSLAYFLFVPLGVQAYVSTLPAEAFFYSDGTRFATFVLNNEITLILAMGLLFQFPLLLWVLQAGQQADDSTV